MSLRAMTLVWERARAKGSNFLMLLAIADYCTDEGRSAWPSVRTLTWKTRLTGRGGEVILQKLITDGEVEPEWSAADKKLYLHVRCVMAWDAYQQEGPAVEPVPVTKSTRENFALKLLALYANRHAANVQPGDPVSEQRASISEKSMRLLGSNDPTDPSEDPRETRARATLPPDDLQTLWNATTTAPIARAMGMTPKRRSHAEQRRAERPLSEWRAIFERIELSRFCRGDNDRGWIASFGWVISSPDVAVKVLEGLYDNRSKPSPPTPFQGRGSSCDHEPPCETRHKCIERTIADGRAERQRAAEAS